MPQIILRPLYKKNHELIHNNYFCLVFKQQLVMQELFIVEFLITYNVIVLLFSHINDNYVSHFSSRLHTNDKLARGRRCTGTCKVLRMGLPW